MSDASQGPGWWQAGDGKWYPPEQAPGFRPPAWGPADGPQGPGWWQANDGKWYSPNQAPGPSGPPPRGGVPPYAAPDAIPLAGPPGFEPVDAIRYGWQKFKDQPGPIIVAMLINFAFAAVVVAITYAIVGSGARNPIGFDDLVPRVVLQIVQFIVSALIQMAIIRAGLGIARGERVELNDMFKADQLVPYLLTSILVGIITGIGFVLCIVPGLVAIVFFQLAGIFVLDQKIGVIDSIKASAHVVGTMTGRFAVFTLLSILVGIAGAIACGVGLLVAVPVITIAQTYVYFRAQGQPVAA